MNFYDVLAAEKWGGGIPTINFFDLLFAQSMGGGEQWQVYEGALPATINANGADMRQYRFYGATGGVGDRTEQLFDMSTAIIGEGLDFNGQIVQSSISNRSDFIKIFPNTIYVRDYNMSDNINRIVHFYDAKKTYIGETKNTSPNSKLEFTTPNSAEYLLVAFPKNSTQVSLTEGTTPPETFVPFGYEVDISTSDGTNVTTTPIYIGSTPLEKDEYVDYQAGKIYRRTENLYNKAATDADNGYIYNAYLMPDGSTRTAETLYIVTEYIPVTPGEPYTFKNMTLSGVYSPSLVWYDSAKQRISGVPYTRNMTVTETAPTGAVYVRASASAPDTFTLTAGDTAPETYIPYLQPTDPPVPLPALPTCDGETVVDYAGESVAPEKVYFEYKPKR